MKNHIVKMGDVFIMLKRIRKRIMNGSENSDKGGSSKFKNLIIFSIISIIMIPFVSMFGYVLKELIKVMWWRFS
jgi:hypothetical protein